jgi:hypothetical protein
VPDIDGKSCDVIQRLVPDLVEYSRCQIMAASLFVLNQGEIIMKYVILTALTFALGSQSHSVAQEVSKTEQIRIAVQQICPVSGRKLGAHGKPVPVKVGEEVVYLCCQGCVGSKVDPQHWQTIHANFARAQGICPIMKKKLPATPKWTIVEGRIVYVCCPPCTDKVTANPKQHLKTVDELYVAHLQAKHQRR